MSTDASASTNATGGSDRRAEAPADDTARAGGQRRSHRGHHHRSGWGQGSKVHLQYSPNFEYYNKKVILPWLGVLL